MRPAHVDKACIHGTLGSRRVTCGASRNDGGIPVVPAVLHSKWSEDVVAKKSLVALVADLLDQVPQNNVAGVAVLPVRSRLEVEWKVANLGHVLCRCRDWSSKWVSRDADGTRDSGSMG